MESKNKPIDFDAWKPCEHCKPSTWPPDMFGPHDFPVVDNAIFYYDVDDGWEGEEINFCPWCCRPLTDAAREMLERKVRGVTNENSCIDGIKAWLESESET